MCLYKNHPPPSSAEVKNEYSFTFTAPFAPPWHVKFTFTSSQRLSQNSEKSEYQWHLCIYVYRVSFIILYSGQEMHNITI